jgi:hypothetical protein
VFEALVEGLDAHASNVLGNQIANRIIDHRARDTGGDAEAVGEIGSHVELAAAYVNFALAGFSERDYSGIQAIYQRSQRQKAQRTIATDFETVAQPAIIA